MMRIDKASLADLDDLVTLESNLFNEDAAQHDTYIDLAWAERDGRADFERLLESKDSVVMVARIDEQIIGHLVGYTHASSPTRLPVTFAVLRSLYVLPDHRRHGTADLLVSGFLDWARDRGCAEAHVDHYALNKSAQRLYERRGFTVRSTARALDLTTPQAGGRD